MCLITSHKGALDCCDTSAGKTHKWKCRVWKSFKIFKVLCHFLSFRSIQLYTSNGFLTTKCFASCAKLVLLEILYNSYSLYSHGYWQPEVSLVRFNTILAPSLSRTSTLPTNYYKAYILDWKQTSLHSIAFLKLDRIVFFCTNQLSEYVNFLGTTLRTFFAGMNVITA